MNTRETFNLRCDVKIYEKSYIEEVDKQQHTARFVALVPRKDNTETWKFITAWVPDTDKEHFEAPLYIGHPIEYPCRGAIMRSSANIDQPHIFVMNEGVLEIFRKALPHGWKSWLRRARPMSIDVRVYPETEDEICDSAPDVNKTIKKTYNTGAITAP